MKNFYVILLFAISISMFSQRNEVAWNKAKEAIKLMDEGKIDESILILEECQKLDSKDDTYPYEIAYAYVLKKEYEKAIKILNKVKKYKNSNSQVYQMSGNCYSYMGKPDLAIKEYEAGMKKFPNSGNLHLEKGNVLYGQEKFNDAVKSYTEGIEAEPKFPSNYYRLTLLYLNSKDKLSGLIYGELFMNLERSTKRTTEISALLFQTYKESIEFTNDSAKIDFCEINIDVNSLDANGFKMPFCGIFGKNFVLSILEQKEINLKSLSEIRTKFLKNYYLEDFKTNPNVLFEFHKSMVENGVFDAYNHYIFQMGAENEFTEWLEKNELAYNEFVKWYTTEANYLSIKSENKFIAE